MLCENLGHKSHPTFMSSDIIGEFTPCFIRPRENMHFLICPVAEYIGWREFISW